MPVASISPPTRFRCCDLPSTQPWFARLGASQLCLSRTSSVRAIGARNRPGRRSPARTSWG
eukprot:13148053-Alexandrium_andersonii.AAC.1